MKPIMISQALLALLLCFGAFAADPATSLHFREPVYPEGADVSLLPELVTYYDERIDRHAKEDW